jgi:hypothetical protein
MTEAMRERYRRDGYVVHEAAIPSRMAADLARQIEDGIDAMAAELDVSRDAYLAAVCRWSTPNPLVEALVAGVTELLRPGATELLGAAVRPGRASVFRKSAEASLGTHGHQDAGYWVRPSSSRYDATSWVALDGVDEHSGALRVVPGSHLGGVAPPADYLAADFIDPAASWGAEARSLPMPAGSAVSFDPKIWHASHAAEPGRARRALAIRWVLEADGASAPAAPAAPSQAAFGMYTSGAFLRAALRHLAGGDVAEGSAGVRWALEHDLTAGLPDPDGARTALERLLVFRRATEAHHASDQRGMVWEPVRDLIVAPTVGLGPLP